MGLDMYLGRYRKPDITQIFFDAEETHKLKDWDGDYNVFSSLPNCFKNIAKEIIITNQFYNMEKISQDFANGEKLSIGGYSGGNILFRNYEKDIKLDLSYEEIENGYLINKEEISYVVQGKFEVAYWRKANQIRQWFVNHIREFCPSDNEEYYKVTKKLLEKLIEDCNYVLDNHDEAENILPSSSGFFFGNTDYDEYYFNQLENTIEMCEKVINETDWDNEVVVYTESW